MIVIELSLSVFTLLQQLHILFISFLLHYPPFLKKFKLKRLLATFIYRL